MKIKKTILFTATMVLALCMACSNEDNNGPLGERISLTSEEFQMSRELSKFQNNFFNSACAVAGDDNNVVVSPLSAQILISMLANATGEEICDEILEVMNCNSLQSVNSFNSKLINGLPGADLKVKVALSNSIWYNDAYDLNPSFAATTSNSYMAGAYKRDFSSPSTVKDINRWCAESTQGMIPEFISSLSPENAILMLNALFFNGEWTFPFNKKDTSRESFHGSVSTTQVDMMHTWNEHMTYVTAENAIAVQKTFGRNYSYSVWFVLPDEGCDVADFSTELDLLKIQAMSIASSANVDLSLPRFKTESNIMDLREPLKKMGIKSLFEPGTFTPFNEALTKRWEVAQKICVEFDEEGAKIATTTKGGDGDLAPPPIPHKVVVLDRPFLFYILENESNSILAAGRIMNL